MKKNCSQIAKTAGIYVCCAAEFMAEIINGDEHIAQWACLCEMGVLPQRLLAC